MREQRIRQLAGTAKQIELPAPFGGFNSRDSRSSMPPQDAITFTNMVSEAGGVKSRLGHEVFTDEVSGNVGFIKEYISGVNLQMVVGAGVNLYEINANGSATTLGSGYSNTDWMASKIGANMVLVNGVDGPLTYNGSSVTGSAGAYTGDIATPGAQTMDGIHLYGNRLYMWDSDAGDFYYGTTNAISGGFAKFALSNVSTTGGNILMMQTITRDGGAGADDYAAFFLDTGEVLVYQGTNPGSASEFALVGKYFIPPPMSKRSAVRLGGDVQVLTRQDVISLSEVMQLSTDGQGFVLNPTKLAGQTAQDFFSYGNNAGWELTVYGKKGWVISNIPETTNTTYHQNVLVAPTKAPAYFTGWNAYTFGIFNNDLYFGGNGVIYKADSGFDDNGSNIQCRAQQAYSIFDVPNRKNVKSVSIRYLCDTDVAIAATVGYDYEDKTPTIINSTNTIGAEWDTASWDTSDWAGALQVRNTKYMVSGTGVAVSVSIGFDISGAQLTWLGTGISMDILTMI